MESLWLFSVVYLNSTGNVTTGKIYSHIFALLWLAFVLAMLSLWCDDVCMGTEICSARDGAFIHYQMSGAFCVPRHFFLSHIDTTIRPCCCNGSSLFNSKMISSLFSEPRVPIINSNTVGLPSSSHCTSPLNFFRSPIRCVHCKSLLSSASLHRHFYGPWSSAEPQQKVSIIGTWGAGVSWVLISHALCTDWTIKNQLRPRSAAEEQLSTIRFMRVYHHKLSL